MDTYAEIPCFVNGEPARAIVRPNRVGSHLELELLWVSVTPGMVVVDLRGNRAA